jgi:hypothetical protein
MLSDIAICFAILIVGAAVGYYVCKTKKLDI